MQCQQLSCARSPWYACRLWTQVGLPKWWEAGALEYPIDNKTLAIIELVVFAFLEGKRYEGYKKTGAVSPLWC